MSFESCFKVFEAIRAVFATANIKMRYGKGNS
jgi:hypothetical protein